MCFGIRWKRCRYAARRSDGGTVSQYSQYYTMPTGPATGTHIIAPQQYQISGNVPATVYFNDQQQAMPYDQYQSSTTYMGGNSLWIQGSTSWTQYARVPQGAFLSLIATSSTGGNGYLNEIYPDGRLFKNNYYYFPGYNQNRLLRRYHWTAHIALCNRWQGEQCNSDRCSWLPATSLSTAGLLATELRFTDLLSAKYTSQLFMFIHGDIERTYHQSRMGTTIHIEEMHLPTGTG